MLPCNIHFNQLPRRSGCYVATSVSCGFQDSLHATVPQPFQATSKMLCMLSCNICVKHFPRCSACYVVTSMWNNFQDAVDATLQHLFHVISKTLWILGCNIHFRWTSKARWMLCCNFRWTRGCFFPKASPMLGFSFSHTCCEWPIRKWREGGRRGNRGK